MNRTKHIQVVPRASGVSRALDWVGGLVGRTRAHVYDGVVTATGFTLQPTAYGEHQRPVRIAVEQYEGYLPGDSDRLLAEALVNCRLPHSKTGLHIVCDDRLKLDRAYLELAIRDRAYHNKRKSA